MRRFFFNIFNNQVTIDYDGLEARDVEAAKERALHEFRSLIAATVLDTGQLITNHRIDVLNEQR